MQCVFYKAGAGLRESIKSLNALAQLRRNGSLFTPIEKIKASREGLRLFQYRWLSEFGLLLKSKTPSQKVSVFIAST